MPFEKDYVLTSDDTCYTQGVMGDCRKAKDVRSCHDAFLFYHPLCYIILITVQRYPHDECDK